MPTLESDIDKQVMELIFLIGTQVENNKAFDFAMFAGYFTLDSLTEIAFGQALGFLTANKDLYKYIQTSTDFFPIMELGTNHPIILNILNSRIMQASAAPKPTDRIGFGAIIGKSTGSPLSLVCQRSRRVLCLRCERPLSCNENNKKHSPSPATQVEVLPVH